MSPRPIDRKAHGLLRRDAEQRGFIEPPPELRALVKSLHYTAETIDRTLELLIDPDGRTLGGTMGISQLDGRHVGQHVVHELIERATPAGY